MAYRYGKARSMARTALASLALCTNVTGVFADCGDYRPESDCKIDYDLLSNRFYKCHWEKEPDPGKCVQGRLIPGSNAMHIIAEFGDRTPDVRALQMLLNANGFKVETDNKFGQETLKALTEFQQKNDLPKTGTDQIVDKKTLDALVTKRK